MLVDSHCHLDYPDFAEELPAVLDRAKAAGVGHMVTICTQLSKFDGVKAVAEAHDNIYCSVGIHPHDAGKEPQTTVRELVELTSHPKVVGIGETGLDFYYDNSPRDDQEASFRIHIGASRETGLPLIIHTREADDKTIEILDEEQEKGAFPGLIHCFSVGRGVAEAAIRHGMYISLSGILTFKNSAELRDIVKDLPLDRLLVETDAPFLAPVPKRGKRNEPSFVRHTAEFAADLLGISFTEMEQATTDNFFRLFSKAAA